MRMLGWLAVLALAGSARGDDIYRWTDAGGGVHYSNSGAPLDGSTRVPDTAAAPSRHARAADGSDEPPPGDADSFSAGVSLRRNALEHDLRASEKRLRELDARLATLARARRQNAGGRAETGGVGANLDVRSEEERTLATEREQVAQHAAEVRSDAARLRAEVTARSGGTTPDWWIDVR